VALGIASTKFTELGELAGLEISSNLETRGQIFGPQVAGNS
jgi:hypothetical protein